MKQNLKVDIPFPFRLYIYLYFYIKNIFTMQISFHVFLNPNTVDNRWQLALIIETPTPSIISFDYIYIYIYISVNNL